MAVPVTTLTRSALSQFLPTEQAIRWAESLQSAAQSFVSGGGGGSLTPSGVAAGNYGTNSSVGAFTVDINGIVTAAADTPIAIAFSQVSGVVPLLQGGTGQTTANAALNALLPSQGGNTGYYLQSNGTDTSWQPAPGGGGGGTVTNIATTAGEITGGPITVTGTLGLATTGVTAATYGSASSVSQVAVDSKGRITSASSVAIAITGAQVSGNIAGNAGNVTGTVAVANGGSGATTLTGYLKGNGTSAFTAVSGIPATDIAGTMLVANGGTGAATFTAGYLKASGTSAFTTVTTIPQADVTGLTASLALKADLASPTFTGAPAAPTAAGGTNTTQLATTAFVTSAVSGKANSSVTITGATSLTGGGDLSANRTLALVNDSGAPGVLKYYGTDSGGTKGFYTLPSPGVGISLVTSTGGSLTVTTPAGPTVNVELAAPVSTANGGTGLLVPFYVATIAAMVALTKALLINGQPCIVEGYAASGDLGGGLFYWDSASTMTVNIGTCFQAAAGGTGRWLRDDPILNVKMFGARGDGATNDTTALQAAIDYTCSVGRELSVPAGTYITNDLTAPVGSAGRFHIYGEPGTVLKAAAASTIILTLLGDSTRSGSRLLENVIFDGNDLAGTTGLSIVDPVNAMLRLDVRHVLARKCDEGIAMSNVQECTFFQVVAFQNTVGVVIETDVAHGGATNLNFSGLGCQENRVGMCGISSSVYPTGGWQLDSPLFQGNFICGLALVNSGSVSGNIHAVNLDDPHFEGNGQLTSPGDTQTVRGHVIPRGMMYMEQSSAVINSGEAGSSIANATSFTLINGSHLVLRDALVGGGSIKQFDCDATSDVSIEGRTEMTGNGNGVRNWVGFNYVKSGGGGGVLIGIPTIQSSIYPTNYYAGTGLFPDAPEAENAVACTPSKVWDDQQGLVQQVAFTAVAGTSSNNRVTFNTMTQSTAVGDVVSVSFLIKSSAATNLVMSITGGATFQYVTYPVSTQWQRVTIYDQILAASAGGYQAYTFPLAADAPTIQFAKWQTTYIPAASDQRVMSDAIRLGLYNNSRLPVYGPSAPATGTWAVGARVINSVPTVGNPKAWSCTVSGSPGTWVSEGNL